MTYIAEDGTEYKCRTEYWKTLYPIRENETIGNYSRRIKKKLFPEYREKIIIKSTEYMRHKYHTNETYKEYQKTKAHNHYYKYKTAINDQLFLEALTNITEGI